ncbi:MAG: hypothetical protein IJ860_09935 [Eubacterium sp.]|nr:hypothetical protein [Eubacterium sp.]
MKKILKRSVILTLVLALLVGTMTTSAFAASTIKVNNAGWTSSYAEANKKATVVKKGTSSVKMKSKGQGFLKFTANKTKTWSFTVSSLKHGKSYSYASGYFYVMTRYGQNNQYIGQEQLVTKGGKNSAMWVRDKNAYYSKSGKVLTRNLLTRTGKIKLQKGQKVFIYFNLTPGTSFKLNIK